MRKVRNFLVGFVLLQMVWFLFTLFVDARVLPTPFAVYMGVGKLLKAGIVGHVGMSLLRIMTALMLSFLVGVPLGFFLASKKNNNRFLNPFVYFAYPIPKTALLPIFMLLLGLGDASKIAILFFTVVFQIMIATKDAALGINESYYQVAISCNAGKRDLFWHITFPAILPALFTGLRINLGTSLAVLLLVEAYGTHWGIGYYILDAWSRIAYIEMYGGIVVISLTGAGLFLLLDLLETRLTHTTEGRRMV